jgi:thioredoxin reductase (NADPH)
MQPFLARFMALATLTVTLSGCMEPDTDKTPSKTKFDVSAFTFDEHTLPVVILGGGIAGMTAALFVAQAKIPCVILEGPKVGGSLAQSASVRNWPGNIDSPGIHIVGDLKKQVLANKIPIVQEKVIGIDFLHWPREIRTLDLSNPTKITTWRTLSVIIAMGKEPHFLGVPGESGSMNYWGKGISNCAPCDGSLYHNKDVIVVGGGDAAITEASYLADIARTVNIVVRKDYFKARDVRAQERIFARPNVKVLLNTEVKAIEGDGHHVKHAALFDNKTGKSWNMPTDGVFLAIGSGPNTLLFRNVLELDAQGFIVLKNCQETSIPGIYAAGDIANPLFAQAIIAAGDGCKAGLQAIKFVKETGFENSGKQTGLSNQAATATSKASHLTDITSGEEFDRRVTQTKQPVIIDVYATLCMSCQQLLPILERVAQPTTSNISWVKLNMSSTSFDGNHLIESIGGEHIHTVPTLIFVANGHEVGRLVNTTDETIIRKKIHEFFKL